MPNAATGSVSVRRRPGCKKVTSRRQDRNIVLAHLRDIVLAHLRDRFSTSVKTAQETFRVNNQRISASTV